MSASRSSLDFFNRYTSLLNPQDFFARLPWGRDVIKTYFSGKIKNNESLDLLVELVCKKHTSYLDLLNDEFINQLPHLTDDVQIERYYAFHTQVQEAITNQLLEKVQPGLACLKLGQMDEALKKTCVLLSITETEEESTRIKSEYKSLFSKLLSTVPSESYDKFRQIQIAHEAMLEICTVREDKLTGMLRRFDVFAKTQESGARIAYRKILVDILQELANQHGNSQDACEEISTAMANSSTSSFSCSSKRSVSLGIFACVPVSIFEGSFQSKKSSSSKLR